MSLNLNLKRLFIIFTTLLLLFLLNSTTNINWALSASIIIIAIILLILARFEASKININYLVLTAALSAFAAVSRIVFVGIASFQPMTFIIMIAGYTWGSQAGFLTGMVSAFVSNLYLGQGPWTPWQMLSWGLCGLVAGWLGKNQDKLRYIPFIILAVLGGLFFGLIMNLWHWLAFTFPLTWPTLIAILAISLPFDMMHSGGNVLFAIIFAGPFFKILHKYKNYI